MQTDTPTYHVHRATTTPPLTGDWQHPAWGPAETLTLTHFHARGTSHQPQVQARLLYDDAALHLLYQVHDHFVRSVCTKLQGPVCQDSCVEFFVRPGGQGGYFNFEINAGGTLHVSFIRDAHRTAEGFADWHRIDEAELGAVAIHHSLPHIVEPELPGPLTWQVQCRIPYAFMAPYRPDAVPHPGARWKANFYKCGDLTSHPHWASWAPIHKQLNFHVPECFAPLHFED